MSASPPRIFSPARRLAARRRMRRLQQREDAPRYLLDDIVEDVIERLAFLRFQPRTALVIGDTHGALAAHLRGTGVQVDQRAPETGFDEEAPYSGEPVDLVASLGTLDTVNDLPGALIHLRQALLPGGLLLASFVSAGSLPVLRRAMLAADGDRPAPRLHPMVDVRAGAQLLQRAGFAEPVADSRTVRVSFSTFNRLIGDLRAQGLGNVLARHGPALTRAQLETARRGLGEQILESFEIITLSGWHRT